MNDKKLLKLAAKAAELAVCDEACHDDDGLFIGNGDGDLFRWNPITDDGDALRLMVKLEIDVWNDGDAVEIFFGRGVGGTSLAIEYIGNGDKYAATRRAIVRAAAEIGKSL
jgi:hypothetical protein